MLRVTETVRSLHFNSIRGADSFSDFEHAYIMYSIIWYHYIEVTIVYYRGDYCRTAIRDAL